MDSEKPPPPIPRGQSIHFQLHVMDLYQLELKSVYISFLLYFQLHVMDSLGFGRGFNTAIPIPFQLHVMDSGV